ncbi:MAG: ATP synthase subunit C [Candidatus Hodarchaeales archaeon]
MSKKMLKKAVFGITFFLAIYLLVSSITIATHGSPLMIQADENTTSTNNPAGEIAIGAGLAIGLAGGGAALGLGTAASAAIAAITEKEELFGKALIFVVLIEGIAIFGFLIALQILGEIGNYAPTH